MDLLNFKLWIKKKKKRMKGRMGEKVAHTFNIDNVTEARKYCNYAMFKL